MAELTPVNPAGRRGRRRQRRPRCVAVAAVYFAESQSSPTPTSTARGGSSSKQPTISRRTSSVAASISAAGPSNRSSSWICRTSRVSRPDSARASGSRHRQLDDVRRGALDHGVDGQALAERRGWRCPERNSGIARRRPISVRPRLLLGRRRLVNSLIFGNRSK